MIEQAYVPSIIEAVGIIVAAAIGSWAGLRIKRNKEFEAKMQRDLVTAYRDIQVLLASEEFYTKEGTGALKPHQAKIKARAYGVEIVGAKWSGKNTNSSISRKIRKLSEGLDLTLVDD